MSTIKSKGINDKIEKQTELSARLSRYKDVCLEVKEYR